MKTLKKTVHKSFKKVRVNKKVRISEENILLTEKFRLINEKKRNIGNADEIQKKIEDTERKLNNLTAKKNRDKVVNNFKSLSGSTGNPFVSGVWKIQKKTFPKQQPSLPAAKVC